MFYIFHKLCCWLKINSNYYIPFNKKYCKFLLYIFCLFCNSHSSLYIDIHPPQRCLVYPKHGGVVCPLSNPPTFPFPFPSLCHWLCSLICGWWLFVKLFHICNCLAGLFSGLHWAAKVGVQKEKSHRWYIL